MNFLSRPGETAMMEGQPGLLHPHEGTGVPVLVQYWDAIYRRKILIAAILGGFLLLGVVVTAMMTPIYTATSRIEISRKQENITNTETLQPEDVGEGNEFFQTQYGLLRARSLAERVARQLNLAADDQFFAMFDVDVGDEQGSGQLASGDRDRRQRIATGLLLQNVTISPIRGSGLVDIEFRSPNPQMSARVANAWVEEFMRSNLDRRMASTADARAYLEQRLGELRTRMAAAERQLVAYAQNNNIVPLSRQVDSTGNTTTERTLAAADLEALATELSVARAARMQAQSEAGRGISRELTTNAAISALRQRRAEAAAEHARMMAQFEPAYPPAQALQSQIQQLDRSIASEEGRVRTSLSTRAAEASRREQLLQTQVDGLKQNLIDQRRDTIQYNIYQRDVDTNRQLYDSLLQRYKEIGVAGVGASQIAVVDRADFPRSPSSPSLPLNLALSLLAGLALCGVTVVALEQIDQSVKDPADVPKVLDIAFLGAIPWVKGDVATELRDKKSAPAEAYFSIQTNLSFLTDHGIPKSFLLTSTRPSEGKSSSAVALGETLTRTGRKVVIIDADMRNPSMHRTWGMKNEAGLSNYLAGEGDYAALLRATENPKLRLMTAGPTPPNAAELLSSDRMGDLVQRLGQEFDHVVVDAPPVLGFADIPLLVGTVEGVIYTIEANGPKMRAIRGALQRLHAANANIFGAIVTKVDSRNPSYGYGYGYGYSYGDNGNG